MSEKVRTQHLECKAILYVRQSSPYQVIHNLESQKLQYEMEARLRQLGWREIEVIDEDLGRSAAGAVTRAGFERMVAEVCLGQVGAVAAGGAAALVPGFRAAMQRTNPTHAVRVSARAANRSSRSCARCFFSIRLRPAWSRGSISKTHRQPQ